MEPKAAASLTSSLLARKGNARPAMRRQPVAGLGNLRAVSSLDDLGWNDMGDDAEASSAPAVAGPSPVAQHIAAIQETLARRDEARAQTVLAAPLTTPTAPAPAPISVEAAVAAIAQASLTPALPRKAKAKASVTLAPATSPAPGAEARAKAAPKAAGHRKSAFTLRIDEDRHLRLRLLSAVTNQSAQQLLIGALDALIAQHPNIDALAADPKVRPGSTD